MSAANVSIIVVSRGRPDALRLCLTGISQLRYPHFEVIVVADRAGLKAIDGLADRIKTVPFDAPNISQARNLGIAQAAGEIVAFIDDDAVPEPTWLSYLVAPFADETVSAVGGFVIGRNGISFQWKARDIRPDGSSAPIAVDDTRPTALQGTPTRGIKTEGTNMAFRRDVLARLGGFDPAYAFYLDESDLNMRLAATGASTAIAPRAQVHHGFAASDYRAANRAPRDLTQIGASLAVFLRRHAPNAEHAGVIAAERAQQRKRLLGHMVAGNLMPGDVALLLRGFDKGAAEAGGRELAVMPPLDQAQSPFLAFAPFVQAKDHVVLSARRWNWGKRRIDAARAVRDGAIVSVYLFSTSGRYHRVAFHRDGYWEQRGGLFGRSLRSDRLWWPYSWPRRLKREVDRVAPVRSGAN
ncbi:glycosyltransferase family 2 protein [Octadecabacter sp. R77987]|uniref:glycosyltransferase family 2 protein n=1 Tax=Octadecabacter sp. R77987 TaxID=3093874 RepID=UPI00366ED5FB